MSCEMQIKTNSIYTSMLAVEVKTIWCTSYTSNWFSRHQNNNGSFKGLKYKYHNKIKISKVIKLLKVRFRNIFKTNSGKDSDENVPT